jgi:thiamine pyrophosphate-dependent acetolactate synthase large subunit-like protein
VKLAEAYGCWTKAVNSPEQFQDAMKIALNEKRPSVVVVQVAREHPRSESPVYGWWDVPKPDYLG